ncbi:histidine phosphatase family protein [Hymenobacter sp. GOD-10R]|uniref:histidine phosphatase family protein n=1 Tax=Hymenobacter sp. GOD-10R TaxID=3093922 RepID=UPI002D76A3EE|nr:histidine phosphatase family protein [Hymenobacter sp. GOD-10R]WRQ28567.1 histidine phosphatase family protein [Hymenobacter sp. GOD-10R]
MTRFLLIRHATTDAVGKRLSGRTPGVALNNEGQAQAQRLAQQLTSLPLDALYSSPLERAVQTAEPIAKAKGLETIICEAVLEMDFGQWTNRTFKELESDSQFQHFNTFRSNTRIPGGELMLEAQARMVRGLEKLGAQHPNQTVAVVSHADLIKAAVAYYAGIHLDMFQRLEISAASVSIVEVYEETARILLINHTGEIKLW